jgi:hypothetical protein
MCQLKGRLDIKKYEVDSNPRDVGITSNTLPQAFFVNNSAEFQQLIVWQSQAAAKNQSSRKRSNIGYTVFSIDDRWDGTSQC